MNLESIRNQFPILKEGLFLNHAATSPVSYGTIERMKELCDEMREPLGKHFYPWLGIMEETRRLLAELLLCHPSEIAFTQNTSTSLSIIALCLNFKAGDRVLIPRDEFPSNRYVWQNLQRQGVECTFFDIPNDQPLVEVLEKQDLNNVRLISVSLVSYITGKKHDLKSFGEFCRKRNITSCVDAIQGVGTFPISLQDSEVDFFVGGAQKWLLGPIGCGYLYIRKELIKEVNVPLVGWTSVQYPESFENMELDFAKDAARFEAGLPSIASIGGLNASLRELYKIGWDTIYQRIASNTRHLVENLHPLVTNLNDLGGIVTFNIPERVNPKKLLSSLEKKGITITARRDYIRVSPHFYNTHEELNSFLETIGNETTKKHLFFPKFNPETLDEEKRILLIGATGILGKEIALYLIEKGFHVTGIGRNAKTLKELEGSAFEAISLDLADVKALEYFISSQKKRYFGLVNCAGVTEAEPIRSLDPEELLKMFQINTVAPTFFMQQFVSKLASKEALGILNIVSPTGRCGYPLMGGYGATHAALWTIGESLSRELCKDSLHVTTYVSSPIHSRMQKEIGRNALRYFKMRGSYNFKHAEEVAREAVDAFLGKKEKVISRKNRFQLTINTLFPSFMTRKISKLWRTEETD